LARQKSTHVDDPVAVGERLRAARRRARLTLRQLAFPGCSAAYLSHIERGRRTPSLQILVELAARLSLNVRYLALGEGTDSSATTSASAPPPRPSSSIALEMYRRALKHARTRDEQVWALAGLGQVAAARGDEQTVSAALQQALDLLAGKGVSRECCEENRG
jgi:transcriptional regulator with XRE-family HTH domain